MTKIKLCGLTRPADIRAVNALLPDCIGFVFAPSKRRLAPDAARALRPLLDGRIQAVGVFMDEGPEAVAALLDEGLIDAAQLHGREDNAYIARLRELTARPIIKAFRIRGADDLARAARSAADHILLDAGAGEGRRFDWGALAGFGRPYILAGGLCPENAAEAVRQLRPYGLDVSSGVETGGLKDEAKLRAFIEAVRGADKGD